MHVVSLEVSHSDAAAPGAGDGCTHTYMDRLCPRTHTINTVATTPRQQQQAWEQHLVSRCAAAWSS